MVIISAIADFGQSMLHMACDSLSLECVRNKCEIGYTIYVLPEDNNVSKKTKKRSFKTTTSKVLQQMKYLITTSYDKIYLKKSFFVQRIDLLWRKKMIFSKKKLELNKLSNSNKIIHIKRSYFQQKNSAKFSIWFKKNFIQNYLFSQINLTVKQLKQSHSFLRLVMSLRPFLIKFVFFAS